MRGGALPRVFGASLCVCVCVCLSDCAYVCVRSYGRRVVRVDQPGKGKFATVYRGVRASDGQPVAIKRVHNFGSLNEKKKEKCIKEVGM